MIRVIAFLQRTLADALRSGPTTLAAMRIVVAAQALWMLLSRDPVGIAGLPPIVWDAVDETFRQRFLLAPRPSLEAVVWTIALVSLVAVLLGIGTRVFGVLAAVLLYHIAPLQSLVIATGPWSKGLTIATITLPILACAPCADRLSIAARWRRGPAPTREPEAYGWAVMLVRLLFAQLYLFSGLAKITDVGLHWISAKTMQHHMLLFALVVPGINQGLNHWIAEHAVVCWLMAAGAIAFELGFVLAVFVRPLRNAFTIGAAAFHAGLWMTLGFRFLNWPHLLLFLDFDRGNNREGTRRRSDA